jgi:cytochrome c2
MIRAMSFAVLLCLAGQAQAAGDPVAGEAAYAKACARCHRSVDRLVPMIGGDDAATRTAYLDGFLADHKAPDPTMRADLIAYLLKVSGK